LKAGYSDENFATGYWYTVFFSGVALSKVMFMESFMLADYNVFAAVGCCMVMDQGLPRRHVCWQPMIDTRCFIGCSSCSCVANSSTSWAL